MQIRWKCAHFRPSFQARWPSLIRRIRCKIESGLINIEQKGWNLSQSDSAYKALVMTYAQTNFSAFGWWSCGGDLTAEGSLDIVT